MTQLHLPGTATPSKVLINKKFNSAKYVLEPGTILDGTGEYSSVEYSVRGTDLLAKPSTPAFYTPTTEFGNPSGKVEASSILAGETVLGVTGIALSPGSEWTSVGNGAANTWKSVCYGLGLFVAIAGTGVGNRVMTSPDGITWTARASASDSAWTSVAFGRGKFIAVGTSVCMTSMNGINWTLNTILGGAWSSICYGMGTFAAVGFYTGSPQAVATSDNAGGSWTSRTSAKPTARWESICYGDNGMFLAVTSSTGDANQVMVSTDRSVWSIRTVPKISPWISVCYGNGRFVAVSPNGDSMMTKDGLNWTVGSMPGMSWLSVCFGGGYFVATGSYAGGAYYVARSKDGVNWTNATLSGSIQRNFNSIAYGPGSFVAVGPGNPMLSRAVVEMT